MMQLTMEQISRTRSILKNRIVHSSSMTPMQDCRLIDELCDYALSLRKQREGMVEVPRKLTGIAKNAYIEDAFNKWWGKPTIQPNVLAAFKAGFELAAAPSAGRERE